MVFKKNIANLLGVHEATISRDLHKAWGEPYCDFKTLEEAYNFKVEARRQALLRNYCR
jgi:hypothetical protein